MPDSFQLKAIITGVNKLSPALTTMQKDLRKFKGEFKDVMQSVAMMGAAIGGAFIIPINQAMEFESSMADVRKVVDFDTPVQFKEMGEDILKLSTELPMAANGIAAIVAAGGQAGIARSDLKAFATDAVKMGIAFDQTAEESGQMMAQWRTAFKLTQSEVVTLADKVNYLGNNGPANAAKISEIVTRIGPLGSVAGLASGEIAAMGATIAGMGVESEIASTGIKNFMLSLTSGTGKGLKGKVLKAIKIDPKQLAADMQKDSKTAILKVLDSVAKLPKAKQAAALEALFGRESLGAIAPLLTNMDLLRENFNKVADAQVYAGSMQKEYESRAATTANAVQLLKNQLEIASITLGDMFLPYITEGTKELKPLLEQFRQWVKANPELIKTVFKLGIYLISVATGVTAVTKAIGIMNFVTKMSPLGKLLTLLIGAGALIVANWDTVGPVFKDVWNQIKPIVDMMGGWEGAMKGLALYMAGDFAFSFLKGINAGGAGVRGLNGALKTLISYGGRMVTIGVIISLFKQLDDLDKEAQATNKSKGEILVDRLKKGEQDRGYTGFIPRMKELLNMDGSQNSKVPLASARPQAVNGEITVKFDNAPPGMAIVGTKTNQSGFGVGYDVGYSPFSNRK
ncbi:phage tail tape measure protein [Yersinia enterocolitica]|uniref:Phage tail tape measure protein, TP901 family, core region n=1 Tax=Yersinia enterocolitica TaxID=630 RepID=A0A0T7P7V7_YEREN|nr:phage tail tape measure protein [Yersinia enterocolitica]EKN3328593.1 phage tail tape measure protein [Yersinia enterocolitica]EKN3412587.1 phage tail tape measure protein [Yersinia enterocolitica]EKN3496500.1 phage tail tape measure protein [Yersinia enterocolitica]EKN3558679.1 phage tail tape measure protein [Yersinia enterocolitica]EKN3694050.1 phage tail tape measure protein [Yersinia enterocolitica]